MSPGWLSVAAGPPLRGEAILPGDKSISHRALILAAVADGTTAIQGLSPAVDVAHTLDCLRALGVPVAQAADGGLKVEGRGPRGLAGEPVVLDCGDSGTTMRLLAGLLAGQDRAFRLEAHASLAGRPMERVVGPLVAMGARIEATAGRPPIEGRGGGLLGAEHALVQASAQVGSAVLLAALNAVGPTSVAYPAPVRDHTERMLAAMGAPLRWDGRVSRLQGPVATLLPPADGRLTVPGDLSGAAFLLAAAALVPGSDIVMRGVGLNPGRTGILDILEAMGAPVTIGGWRVVGGEPVGDLRVQHPGTGLRAASVGGELVPRAIDELPLLAVLATQAQGLTRLRDAAELRVKETDRLAVMAEALGRMGADIRQRPDGWDIQGPTPLQGARLDGRGDHRVVMALTVAGLVAAGTTVIDGAERVDDSFPGFAAALRGLGARVSVAEGPEGLADAVPEPEVL